MAPDFTLNSFTTALEFNPSVAVAGDGRFVAAWEGIPYGSGPGVFARRFDANGVAAGAEFRVDTGAAGFPYGSALTADPAGNFVVVWQADTDIWARRYDAFGVARGGEFRVNAYTTGYQSAPSAASDAAGNFLVAWETSALSPNPGVFARWYDRRGAPGAEFRVNSVTTIGQYDAAVAFQPDGSFVVSWSSTHGAGKGVVARLFQRDWIFADGFELGPD